MNKQLEKSRGVFINAETTRIRTVLTVGVFIGVTSLAGNAFAQRGYAPDVVSKCSSLGGINTTAFPNISTPEPALANKSTTEPCKTCHGGSTYSALGGKTGYDYYFDYLVGTGPIDGFCKGLPQFSAPKITNALPISIAGTVGTAINPPYQFTYSDVDVGDSVTWSATGLPAGASLDPTTGVFSWTPTTAASSNFTVKATDTHGLFSEVPVTATAVIPLPVYNAPVITNTLPITIAGTVGTAINPPFQFTFSDADAGDSVTWSATSLPAGASLDPTTGILTWTPTSAFVSAKYTVKVTDTHSLSSSVDVTFSAAAAPYNNAPVVTSPAKVSSPDLAQSVSIEVCASDDGTVSSFEATANGAPVANIGASFTTSTVPTVSCPTADLVGTFTMPANSTAGTYNLAFTAIDDGGKSGSAQTTLILGNSALELTSNLTSAQQVQTVTVGGAALSIKLTASDVDCDALEISSDIDVTTIPGASWVSATAAVNGTCSYTRTFSYQPSAVPTPDQFKITFTATEVRSDQVAAASASLPVDIKVSPQSTNPVTISALNFNNANWNTRYKKVQATGTVQVEKGKRLPTGLTVTINYADAAGQLGAQIGVPVAVKINRSKPYLGTWSFEGPKNQSPVPCRIAASSGGLTKVASLRGAPLTCWSHEDDDDDSSSTSSTSSSSAVGTTPTSSTATTPANNGKAVGKGKKS
jgi:hypothetical protein